MNHFSDIVGQDAIRDHLQDAVKTGRISHAYILDGPKDSGRHFIAGIFAAAVQCTDIQSDQNGMPEPCGSCISCIQADAGSQPDIIYVRRRPKNGKIPRVLSVEEIRQMRDDAAVKPYASARKIYIVEDAELMNTQAQNALLKTLEEPPAYVVIILIADGTSRFLPTVMSRCITLHMKQVPEETMIRFLMKERGISEEKARLCASFAVGNLGRAVKIADDPDFDNQRKDAEQILAGITEMSFTDIVNIANDIFPKKKAGADENAAAVDEGKKKESIHRLLPDCIPLWYRDVCRLKAGGSTEGLILSDCAEKTGKAADEISYEGIERILREISEYQRELTTTSPETALQLLLVKIRDELRAAEKAKKK